MLKNENPPNGKYINGTLYIDVNAGSLGEGTMLFTMSHELTHFIKQWSPAQFRKLADYVLPIVHADTDINYLIDKEIEKSKNTNNPLTREGAEEEIVANALESMLSDDKDTVINNLIGLKNEDERLFNKIVSKISKWADEIHKFYNEMLEKGHLTSAGRAVAEMADDIDGLRDMFTEALKDAGKNFQSADVVIDKKLSKAEEENRFSTKDISELERGEFPKKLLINGIEREYNGHNPLSTSNRANSKNYSSIKWVYDKKIFSIVENKMFMNAIEAIRNNKSIFPKVKSGDYMIQIENKLVFTDGDFDYPNISKIIEFMSDSAERINVAKGAVLDAENRRQNISKSARFVSNVLGDGFVVQYTSGADGVYEWGAGARKGKTRRAALENYIRMQDRRGNASKSFEDKIISEPSSKDGGFSMPKFSTKDSEYLALAKNPEQNKAKLRKMVDEAAREKEYDIKAYHYSNNSFNIFDTEKQKIGTLGKGFYFSPNKETFNKYGKNLYNVFLKGKNFYTSNESYAMGVVSEINRELGDKDIFESDVSKILIKNGYDGVIFHDWDLGEIITVFKPTQVKSADTVTYDDNGNIIPLSERFNENDDDIRYSIRDSFYDEFDKAVNDDSYYKNNAVVVGNIPALFSKYGYDPSKPLTITARHCKDIIHKKVDGIKKYHGLSKENIINAISQLESPALLIKSPSNENVMIAFTTVTDSDDIPVAIYIAKNGRAYINSVETDSNHILSIYGRDNTVNFINSAIKDNRVVDGNKKRADELQNILGIMLSLPDNILSIGSNNSIPSPSENVNRNSTRDSDGNVLSEKQIEYFKDSKVRDKNGNLLKVYHGTDSEFTIFDRSKSRTNADIQGNFFSPYEIEAYGYGENVSAYYLNITNPASESEGYKALKKFVGQNNVGIKAREYLESLGYDGVANYDEYIAFYPEQIKLIDNTNPTSDSDIRYSFRGENSALTERDKNNLSIAKEMSDRGDDSEKIRLATGWFKGYDGKWRNEIDDSKAVWNDNAKTKIEPNIGDEYIRLPDLVKMGELYEYYPELKDVRVYIAPYIPTAGLVYGGSTSGIYMKEFKPSSEFWRDMLTHELQHIIQNIEGFASGSSQSEFSQLDWGEKEYSAVDKRNELADKLYAILRRHGVKISKEEIEDNKYGWTDGFVSSVIDSNYFLLSNLADSSKRTRDIFEEYYEQVQILNSTTPYGQYMRTAGEIEAYDVQARRRMNEEQRKNTRPNIDRTDVLFADGGASYSIGYTTNNIPVAIVENNILDGVPKSQWIKRIKNTITEKFSNGVPISGRLVKVNKISKNEFVNSKYSRYLKSSDGTIYADKFKTANNLDDVVLASTNYINEDLKHTRSDSIKEFARGDVLIRVGEKDYSAKVIIGLSNSNSMVLYDVVDFNNTTFKLKKKTTRSAMQNAGSQRNEPSSNNSISNSAKNVNRNSVRDSFNAPSDIYSFYNNKIDESREMTMILNNLGENYASMLGKVVPDDMQIRKLTSELIKQYNSKIDAKYLNDRIRATFDYMANTNILNWSQDIIPYLGQYLMEL